MRCMRSSLDRDWGGMEAVYGKAVLGCSDSDVDHAWAEHAWAEHAWAEHVWAEHD